MLLNDNNNSIYQHFLDLKPNFLNIIQFWRDSKINYCQLTILPKELNIIFKDLMQVIFIN